jgi:putative membrane protein
MIQIIARWIINALSLYIVAQILPGIHLSDFGSALIAVLIIGLVNALIKPVLFLLTLPVTVITLGLFSFVLNALMLMLASSITPGFKIDGFGTALLGSILLSIVTTILQSLVK